MNTQRIGGIAALYLAAAYLLGIVLFFFVLDYASMTEPGEKVAVLVDNQAAFYTANLLMYVVFGAVLIVLVLSLYERLVDASPVVVRTAAAIGIIWAGSLIASGMVANAGVDPVVTLYEEDPAQAAITWAAVESVANGLGGANGEVLGGLLMLLVSWAALQVHGLPRGLNYLGILVGVVGLVSTIPGLSDLVGAFGVGQIVWFIWLGLVLLQPVPSLLAHRRLMHSEP